MNKNMLTRVISGIFLLLLTTICNYFGGMALLSVLFVFSLIGIYEFYRAVGILRDGRRIDPLSFVGYLFTAAYYVSVYFSTDTRIQVFFIVCEIVLAMGVFVFTFPRYRATEIAYGVFGFLYAPLMLSFLYYIRMLDQGHLMIWLVYIVSWVCDTFAYFTGMAFGKHKLAPNLSPKKSIEGAIGGVVGTALAGFLFSYFLLQDKIPHSLWEFPLVCVIGAVVSQIGDLSASAIKRNHEIKDYGYLIPGHGGILDRFDSVIFTAPMLYFLLIFVIQVSG